MNDERRDEARSHTFSSVELVTVGPGGIEASFPLILRDSGGTGLGGVYVGQEVFAPEGDAVLRDPEADDRQVRIAWTKKVADYLHMVGLELTDTQ